MKELQGIHELISQTPLPRELKTIAGKVSRSERISGEDALVLYQSNQLGFLAYLATHVRKTKNQTYTFFNKNIHVEPTNICVYNCAFCSYQRKKGEKGAWEHSIAEIASKLGQHAKSGITEVHIVGGTHPERDFGFYLDLVETVKNALPFVQIKAFTAVELEYMFQKTGISIERGLGKLKEKGLVSLPGGGAEIFNPEIRSKICPQKTSPKKWLQIHETAHKLGIPTNATMLYGHLENYGHRVEHLAMLRDLQDKTKGFQAFIPLKYKCKNNTLSKIGETTLIEDFKNYAVSRIFLDNFDHIKAYWPMLGKKPASMALSYGVDDIDGTIEDSTQIYSMAGSQETNPQMTVDELVGIIQEAGFVPVERDTLYNRIKTLLPNF